MKKKDEIKVCLVGSSGGHLTHLYMLKPFWKDKNRFWVTFDKEDARSLLEGEKVYPCYFPTNRSIKALIKNTKIAWDSELTALYWIWKNDVSDVTGIVHYRRYLSSRPRLGYDGILNDEEIEKFLGKYQMIVAKPRFYIEGVDKHYINCHKTQHQRCKAQLSILESVIKETQPDYLEAYRKVMKSKSAHMFNMFITSRKILADYCGWLFPILYETEKRIDEADVSYERLMGSLSEFLLDVWIKSKYSF